MRLILVERVKVAQSFDPQSQKIANRVKQGKSSDFVLQDDILRFGSRLCLLNDPELKKEIMEDAHSSSYSLYRRSTKMYKDLRSNFWWINMK